MDNKWIPINDIDMLPGQGTAVLVCGMEYAAIGERKKAIAIGWVNKDEDPNEPIVSMDIEEIRYWMMMPEMPEF